MTRLLFPSETQAPRLIALALVLGLHGLACWLVLHLDSGLPVPAPHRVLQVSWLAGDNPAAAPGGSAATPAPAAPPPPPVARPAPPKAAAPKPIPRPKPTPQPKPAPIARRVAATPTEAPARKIGPAAEGAAGASPSASGASGRSGAGAAGTGGGGGAAGFTAPRFDAAYLSNPAPDYPAQSRELEEEGRVFLRVQVSAEGRAAAVRVHKSSGYERLDEAAMAAVRRWRFIPGRLGDQAVAAAVIVPINFFLR